MVDFRVELVQYLFIRLKKQLIASIIKHCVLECGRIRVITKIYIEEKAINLRNNADVTRTYQ